MKPKAHQRRAARKLVARLLKYGIACLWGATRSGKTLSFILAALNLKLNEVLIITKKSAIDDIKAVAPSSFIVTNFHQVKNLTKKQRDNLKLVIVDECHRYISSATPKRSPITKEVREMVYWLPILLSSATPSPETYTSLYSTLWISCKSPFKKYKNFTAWHKDYGIPAVIVRGYDRAKRKPLYAPDYTKGKVSKIKKAIEHLIVTITDEDARHKFLPEDVLHHVPLSHRQQRIYNVLDKDKLYELPNDYSIVCDKTNIKQKKHQISGGFVNIVNDYNELDKKVYKFNRLPKVEYIKQNFDINNTIIMAYYIPEYTYLATIFPHTGSITKMCEGTDYSHFETMVIYSFGFHAVTYEQIIARLKNLEKRKTPIKINFLLSGIDQYVYDAVSNKKNFTASWYKGK